MQQQSQIWPGWNNQSGVPSTPWYSSDQPQTSQTNYQYYSGLPTPVTWPSTYYQPSNTTEFSNNNSANFKNVYQRENDQEWVNEWLKKLNKGSYNIKEKTASNLSIPEWKTQVTEALTLLQDLSNVHNQLKESVVNGDESLWNFRSQKAVLLKEKLDKMQDNLSVKSEEATKKISRIKKKRKRKKKRNEELKNEARNVVEMREKLHSDLDDWQNQIYERVKQNKKEEELKKEADGILSEVRKKISESKKALELIKALQKLRSLKKQSAERKGLFTTKESDDLFANSSAVMEKMLENQLNHYQDEEKALCVMLDREAEKKEADDLQSKLSIAHSNIKEFLFGNSEPSPEDPVYPFSLFYTQAERSLDSLLCIRQAWDSYCSKESDGCSAPFQWVTPDNPSNENWEKVLDIIT